MQARPAEEVGRRVLLLAVHDVLELECVRAYPAVDAVVAVFNGFDGF